MDQLAGTTPPGLSARSPWWREALIIVGFYLAYTAVRNQIGTSQIAGGDVTEEAFRHAELVIRFERSIGIYHERAVQGIFLDQSWFIIFWNVFYPVALFSASSLVFVLLYLERPGLFGPWRTTLLAMNGLALIVFVVFPLMPPRLLDAPCPKPGTIQYGGACIESELRPGQFDGTNGFGYVDTLSAYGGFWKFDSRAVASISNQYAALPSMHLGWAIWCAAAAWSLVRRRLAKIALLAYPPVTLFCVVVTANHYWVDGVGGLVVFGLGAIIGWGPHLTGRRRHHRCPSVLEPERPITGRANLPTPIDRPSRLARTCGTVE